MNFAKDNKGQGIADTIISMPVMFILLFIAFTIMNIINTSYLFPIVANLSGGYSTLIRTILEIVPLMMVILVLMVIVLAARGRSSGYQPGF